MSIRRQQWKVAGAAAAISVLALTGAFALPAQRIFAAGDPTITLSQPKASVESVAPGGDFTVTADVANVDAETTSQNVTLTVTIPSDVSIATGEDLNVTVTGQKAETTATTDLSGTSLTVKFDTPDNATTPVTTTISADVSEDATADSNLDFSFSAAVTDGEADPVTQTLSVPVTAAADKPSDPGTGGGEGGAGDGGNDGPSTPATPEITVKTSPTVITLDDENKTAEITYTLSNGVAGSDTGNIAATITLPTELALVPSADGDVATFEPSAGATATETSSGFTAEIPPLAGSDTVAMTFTVEAASADVEAGSYGIDYSFVPTNGKAVTASTVVALSSSGTTPLPKVAPLEMEVDPATLNAQQGSMQKLSVAISNPNQEATLGAMQLEVNVPTGFSVDGGLENGVNIESGAFEPDECTVTESESANKPGFVVSMPDLIAEGTVEISYNVLVSDDCPVGPTQVNYTLTADDMEKPVSAATTMSILAPDGDEASSPIRLAIDPATATMASTGKQTFKFTATNESGSAMGTPVTLAATVPSGLTLTNLTLQTPLPEGVEVAETPANGKVNISSMPANASVTGTFEVGVASGTTISTNQTYDVTVAATGADSTAVATPITAKLTVTPQSQTSNTTTNNNTAGTTDTTQPLGTDDGTVVQSKIADKMPQTGVIALGAIAGALGIAALGVLGYKKYKETHPENGIED